MCLGHGNGSVRDWVSEAFQSFGLYRFILDLSLIGNTHFNHTLLWNTWHQWLDHNIFRISELMCDLSLV
jgi:hypothetical protein